VQLLLATMTAAAWTTVLQHAAAAAAAHLFLMRCAGQEHLLLQHFRQSTDNRRGPQAHPRPGLSIHLLLPTDQVSKAD
jgi:hypothetical protein